MIAAAVVSLGVGLGFFFSKRTPTIQPPPAPVNVSPAKSQDGAVVYANSLPGGNNNNGNNGPAGGERGGRGVSGF